MDERALLPDRRDDGRLLHETANRGTLPQVPSPDYELPGGPPPYKTAASDASRLPHRYQQKLISGQAPGIGTWPQECVATADRDGRLGRGEGPRGGRKDREARAPDSAAPGWLAAEILGSKECAGLNERLSHSFRPSEVCTDGSKDRAVDSST